MEELSGREFGKYQIIEPLGRGGMAAVYRAYQPSMDRFVAIKVLPRQLAEDPASGSNFIKRFEQEAKVVAKLQYPFILPVHDYGEADGYTFLVMPLVKGGTLASLMHSRTLEPQEIREIVVQIGSALDYAHRQGVVHRDVKPSNVLIDSSGNCLLTDFGIARIVADNSKLTGTGNLIGTPAYMSPEQGRGDKTIDHRSDIYSLGVMLYEMATGKVPFDAETPVAIVIKHIQAPLMLPSSVNPSIPESLERVILRSMTKEPDDRFQTAGEMVSAIKEAIPDRPQPVARTFIEKQPQIQAVSPNFEPPSIEKKRPKFHVFDRWFFILAAYPTLMFTAFSTLNFSTVSEAIAGFSLGLCFGAIGGAIFALWCKGIHWLASLRPKIKRLLIIVFWFFIVISLPLLFLSVEDLADTALAFVVAPIIGIIPGTFFVLVFFALDWLVALIRNGLQRSA